MSIPRSAQCGIHADSDLRQPGPLPPVPAGARRFALSSSRLRGSLPSGANRQPHGPWKLTSGGHSVDRRAREAGAAGTAAWSCALLLGLTACAGRETVKSSYVGTASMSTDQVRQLLMQQGYTRVTSLHENGRDWIGNAKK